MSQDKLNRAAKTVSTQLPLAEQATPYNSYTFI